MDDLHERCICTVFYVKYIHAMDLEVERKEIYLSLAINRIRFYPLNF